MKGRRSPSSSVKVLWVMFMLSSNLVFPVISTRTSSSFATQKNYYSSPDPGHAVPSPSSGFPSSPSHSPSHGSSSGRVPSHHGSSHHGSPASGGGGQRNCDPTPLVPPSPSGGSGGHYYPTPRPSTPKPPSAGGGGGGCPCSSPPLRPPSHGGGGGYYGPPSPSTPVIVTPPSPRVPSSPPSHGGGGGGGGYYGPPSPSTPVIVTPPSPLVPSSPPSHGGGGGGGGYYGPPSPSTPVIVTPPSPLVPSPPYVSPITPIVPSPPLVPRTPSPFDPNCPPFPCTYWGSHPTLIFGVLGWWATVGGLFGVTTLPELNTADYSLQHILMSPRKDGYGSLYREATAAVLNSMATKDPKDFPFSTKHVRDAFVASLSSDKAAAAQARLFKLANEGKLKA